MADFGTMDGDGQTKLLPRFREMLPNGVSYEVIDSDASRTLGGTVHTIAANQIFLLGDNRDDTDDMHDSYDAPHRIARPPTLGSYGSTASAQTALR